MDSAFDLNDYIEAAGEASRRARVASLVLVVSCILVFAGLLNSLQSSWMLQRIHAIAHEPKTYLETKLATSQPLSDAMLSEWRQIFEAALVRSYVENSYAIKVPFFGVTFDANDLGLLGGVGLFISLCYVWFCIVRERDNLELSFQASSAYDTKDRRTAYELLAMTQVLTAPPHGQQRWLLGTIPIVIVFLPFLVQCAVVAHDLSTFHLGRILSNAHTLAVTVTESMLLAAILAIAVMCLLEIHTMNRTWRKYHDLFYRMSDKG